MGEKVVFTKGEPRHFVKTMGNTCQKADAVTPTKATETAASIHEVSLDGPAAACVVAEESSHAQYVRVMQPLLCAPTDLSADLGLLTMANGNEGRSSSRMKALQREIRELRNHLPCSPSSTIFVRYDRRKPYFMKALITGPEDTPYHCGAFVFDIFFPDAYPNVPPLVLLRTTGGGTVRFNPNLYDSGKVCLSLLGTWSGTHACEKWTTKSTLLQVLVSIQGLILVKYPYYNEPGRSAAHTPENSPQVAMDINGGFEVIRAHTLRWAIADAIRVPIAPFQEVIHAHFALQARTVIDIARKWASSVVYSSDTVKRNTEDAVKLVHQELAKLPPLDATPPATLNAVVTGVVSDIVSAVETASSTGSSPTMVVYLTQAMTHGGAGLDASPIVPAALVHSYLESPPFFMTPDKPTTREVAMTGTSVGIDALLEIEGMSHIDELMLDVSPPGFEGNCVPVA